MKMMKLSHILYKVEDLEKAVKEFTEMGFTVVYGSNPKKATNAMIWFEEGPFIELFTLSMSSFLMGIITFVLKLMGKKSLLKRVILYQTSPTGFCDTSIETEERDLSTYTDFMEDKGFPCDTTKVKRTNIKGEKLIWQISAPPRIDIPFLMSAYNIEQRPDSIVHKNGAKCISKVILGTDKGNFSILKELTDDTRIEIKEGSGLIDVIIDGWDNPILHPNRK